VAALSCALPFQGIAEELLQVLLEKYLEDKFFPNEHTIFSPDDKYEDLYIIFNGSVDYCLSGPSF
jgi:CRP-like cAMP-binding protein